MILRYLVPALLVALLAAGGAAWFFAARLDALGARLEQAEAAAAGYREAADALSRHLATLEAEAARWRAIAAELDGLEGSDAPLNAYERGVLERVREP